MGHNSNSEVTSGVGDDPDLFPLRGVSVGNNRVYTQPRLCYIHGYGRKFGWFRDADYREKEAAKEAVRLPENYI